MKSHKETPNRNSKIKNKQLLIFWAWRKCLDRHSTSVWEVMYMYTYIQSIL